jgi:hypothetical protein
MCLPQSPGLDLLRQAVEKLRSETSERPPGSLAGAELVELHRLLESLRSVFSSQLRDLERSGAYAAQGALSAAAWLRSECRLSPNAAAEQVRVARSLPQLPETAAAFAAGEISFAHAAQLSRCAEEVGLATLQEAQPLLLSAARQLDPLRLRLLTRHLRYCLDPDGAQAAAEELHQRRGLHLSQSLEGVFYLEGRLEAEGGSLLQKALEACSGPRTAEDRRSPSQRRADALVELCRQQLDAGRLPQAGGQRPHLQLRAELQSLLAGGPAGELENGQPLGPQALRRIACDASLESLLLSAEGQPLAAGRSRRVVSGAGGQRGAAAGAGGAGRGLPLPGLRPAPELERRPPPAALGGGRRDHARQHRPALQASPPPGPRGGLAAGGRRIRRVPSPAALAERGQRPSPGAAGYSPDFADRLRGNPLIGGDAPDDGGVIRATEGEHWDPAGLEP